MLRGKKEPVRGCPASSKLYFCSSPSTALGVSPSELWKTTVCPSSEMADPNCASPATENEIPSSPGISAGKEAVLPSSLKAAAPFDTSTAPQLFRYDAREEEVAAVWRRLRGAVPFDRPVSFVFFLERRD